MQAATSSVKPGRPAAATSRDLHLLRELIRRDFNARFTGSALGLAWAVLQPLSLVILYWFVFTLMIPARTPAGAGNSYIYFLIAGLVPWLGFHEGLLRATTAIVDNSSIVRRLPLRSELLVVTPNISALIFECIGLAIFLSFLLARGTLPRMIWILPFALAAQLLLQLGISFFLAAMYVFFRDLTQILGFVLSILFYLSPILYPVGGRFEKFFFWNPLTAVLGLFRSALLASPLPEAGSIVFLLVVASGVFAAGLLFFRRAQPTLVDLI
jgi:lipopolysaccharide transport system permease protein